MNKTYIETTVRKLFKKQYTQYTTTSSVLQKRLGVDEA